jgi:hypothetical protein
VYEYGLLSGWLATRMTPGVIVLNGASVAADASAPSDFGAAGEQPASVADRISTAAVTIPSEVFLMGFLSDCCQYW